ncbi:MAG: group 1 truncated hemoglobin [Tahibacter sp.]
MFFSRTFIRVAFLALFSMALGTLTSGCASDPRKDDSLYRALGGETGNALLVDKLLEHVYADARIAFLFKDADRANLSRLIREQFCHEAGGPCEYSGRSMAESHSGMGLKAKEFDAFVDDFIDAMEEIHLPYRTQNRMLRIFAPMRPQVIDK